jgi:hypothetical protein
MKTTTRALVLVALTAHGLPAQCGPSWLPRFDVERFKYVPGEDWSSESSSIPDDGTITDDDGDLLPAQNVRPGPI